MHRRARPARPALLLSAAGSSGKAAAKSGWHAAGGIAGLALATEVVQLMNTAVGMFLLQRATGASSFVDLVEAISLYFTQLGPSAYPLFAVMLLFVTVLPLMSAILFIVLAGMVFGAVKGTLVVSLSLSTAAMVSALLARAIAARRGYGLANIDPGAVAVDAALAQGPVRTSLMLVTLLRLSPVMPFTFSNYLAGLTSLPAWVIFLGTLLGTLPTQAVYVGAGALGRSALQGGVKLPPAMLAMGGLATLAAIVLVGRVAQQTLAKMDLDGSAKSA